MTGSDLLAILPFLVLAAAAVAVMLLIAVRRDHRLIVLASAAAFVLPLAALAVSGAQAPRAVTPLFVIDGFALFYLGLVLAAGLAVVLLSYGYFDGHDDLPREEYYLLLLLATLGAAALVASSHFASFFLGLETLSISLLGLIAYPREHERSVEAGIKYLILSGASSAFLLFGIALVYDDLGTMSFPAIGAFLREQDGVRDIYWLTGLAMILTGIGFKLSLVPFHMWAPDVYEGAPAPVAGFVAVVSKSAVFALLLRYFMVAGGYSSGPVLLALMVVAILSMIVGNLLALLQANVKRILAYSSIAHLGYVLVAFLAGGAFAVEAVTYYLVAYAVTTLGAFGVVTLLSQPGAEHDSESLAEYRGLFWSRPWLAGVFTAMLLSLAGIPLTMGFIAKFYAMAAGIGADLLAPVIALILGSVIGLYYYLRIIIVMYMSAPASAAARAPLILPWSGSGVLATLVALLIWLGVYPSPLIVVIRMTAERLAAG